MEKERRKRECKQYFKTYEIIYKIHKIQSIIVENVKTGFNLYTTCVNFFKRLT